MVRRILLNACGWSLLALWSVVQAATITVTPDRTRVNLNESFQLVYEAAGDPDGDPDFSVLEPVVQVLSTVQSSNFSVINGQVSSSRRWTLTVIANEAGQIILPAVPFGSDRSPSLGIEVTDSSTAGSSNSQGRDDIFLEAYATPEDPYVQSQVIYTLKLFRSVAIAKASLGEPEITSGNAVLERIDDDRSYELTLDGQPYYVIERNYAVYPQSSGEVTISAVNFMGQVSRTRFGLDPFGPPPRTVVRRSPPVTLDVRSVPADFPGNHWLPAENVSIAEEWSVEPSRLRAGEPVTRTLIISARGLTASQLPELPGWNLSDVKYYPDRPVLNDEKSAAGINSSRREKAALIPTLPGTHTLPEISIPWWNTRTNRLEYAVLPERALVVAPAPGAATGAQTPDTILPELSLPEPVIQTAAPEGTSEPPGSEPVPDATPDRLWQGVSLALVILWLSTLALWWQRTRGAGKTHAAAVEKPQKAASRMNGVIEAASAGDPQRTRSAILDWARAVWPEQKIVNLGVVAAHASDGLANEITRLNAALYRQETGDWNGNDLAELFRHEAAELAESPARRPGQKGHLEPLYRL